MALMSEIVSRARVMLQDPGEIRWSNDDLLVYANEALGIARTVRPDLFKGQFAVPQGALTNTDTFPLPFGYEGYTVDYVAGRAHFREIEFASDPHAVTLFQLYKAGLLQL
jgi:hypothetical protein